MTPIALTAAEPAAPPLPVPGLRVMQVVLSLAPGGTERLVIEIVRRLHPHLADSVVCCLEDRGAWAPEVEALGVPVVALHRRPGFSFEVARAIAQLIARHRIDVLHCHHYSPFVYGQLGALLSGGTRVVFTEHGRLSDAPPSKKRRLVNPLLGRLPAAVYAVSEDLRHHMLAEGFAPHLVQPLHNGIEIGPQTTVFARRHARRQLGIDHRSLVVGTVARLDPVKDLPTLIDAFALMRRDRADARLVVIGDGPERQALTDAAARADVAGAVLFTGHRQDVRALLPAFDIFANSSIHEGVSLTILEAMAADIPVVATRAGGNPEVVDAASGLLVPCRDVAAFAGALAALATDDARRQRMGAAARARVESRFSVERMVGAYLASYRGDPRPADTGIPASVAAGS